MSILKIFVDQAEVAEVTKQARLIERYDAFVLLEAEPNLARELARRFPTEDITGQYRMPLEGVEKDPLATVPKLAARSRPRSKASTPDSGPHHYIVQFVGPIKQQWINALKRAGATLRHPTSGFGHVVRADGATLARIRALAPVRWVGHLPHADRVASTLAGAPRGAAQSTLPRRRVVPGSVTVEVFGAEDLAHVTETAKSLGFTALGSDKAALLLTLASDATDAQQREQVRALSTVHGVRFIRQRVLARTSNNIALGITGRNALAAPPSGFGLTGEGEIVAVCDTGLDTGDAATIHPDFAGRIVALKSYPITADWSPYITNPAGNDGAADIDSGHGTHVAGSVLGDGSASSSDPTRICGYASKARLVFQSVEQEMRWKSDAPPELRRSRFILSGIPVNLAPLFQFAYNQGARIHSNSWGGGDAGEYDNQCAQFDDFVWKHKDMCFVIAAGNDGSDADADGNSDGRINPGSVTSPGTAKNCITVGACENLRPEFNFEHYGDWWPKEFPVGPFKAAPMADNPKQVAAFSSRGPTADSRVKPDVVAPGTFILSTRSTCIGSNNFAWGAYPPNGMYFHMGGTSMATPLTSGALALIREFLRTTRNIASPTAALLKAQLVAGVERLPGTAKSADVLDSNQGFGRINIDRSLRKVIATIEGGGLRTGQMASHSVSVTSGTRTLRIVMAYSDFPGVGLVNNLNLIVTDPAGKRHVGNHGRGVDGAMALDGTNNVELVQIVKAQKGTWKIDIVASNVARGPQDFAVAAVLV